MQRVGSGLDGFNQQKPKNQLIHAELQLDVADAPDRHAARAFNGPFSMDCEDHDELAVEQALSSSSIGVDEY